MASVRLGKRGSLTGGTVRVSGVGGLGVVVSAVMGD
ncbi:MAG: hypothetical protein KatS3mg057_1039 [Herpetosiphonaceae bacterium]|nr:MAG: hypothetical protein KatS3mg057_1039 [Herpetosiphonaceae bacterium]